MPPLPEASMPYSTMSSRRVEPLTPFAYMSRWYRAISEELIEMNSSASSLLPSDPGSGIAFNISDLHAVVEHKTLSGRQRPYGAEQFTGFRRTCQSFRHAGTGVDGVYAIRREL